ncbi:Ig-like domain-containing protein [Rhizobium sp. 969_B3_N1_2]|uniref:Ig-like domain-containing protein n=1 Tax=Rhizobium sp. 969_B3_N1_2 TaxID=3276278 RepID=UPI003F234825
MTSQYQAIAENDHYEFYEGATIRGSVTENDYVTNPWARPLLRFFDGEGVDAKHGPQHITSIDGEYGTFHLKPDGTFTYDLRDDVAATLDPGEKVTEHVSYKISDGNGNTDVAQLTLDIKGYVAPASADTVVLHFDDISGFTTEPLTYKGFALEAAYPSIVDSQTLASTGGPDNVEGNAMAFYAGLRLERADHQAFDLNSIDLGIWADYSLPFDITGYTSSGEQYVRSNVYGEQLDHIILNWKDLSAVQISSLNDGSTFFVIDDINVSIPHASGAELV